MDFKDTVKCFSRGPAPDPARRAYSAPRDYFGRFDGPHRGERKGRKNRKEIIGMGQRGRGRKGRERWGNFSEIQYV